MASGQDGARVDQVSQFLRCVVCGDRIGVYEPIWLELADGGLHRSSYLNLGDYHGLDRSRLWHLECLIPTAIPDPMRHSDGVAANPGDGGTLGSSLAATSSHQDRGGGETL